MGLLLRPLAYPHLPPSIFPTLLPLQVWQISCTKGGDNNNSNNNNNNNGHQPLPSPLTVTETLLGTLYVLPHLILLKRQRLLGYPLHRRREVEGLAKAMVRARIGP